MDCGASLQEIAANMVKIIASEQRQANKSPTFLRSLRHQPNESFFFDNRFSPIFQSPTSFPPTYPSTPQIAPRGISIDMPETPKEEKFSFYVLPDPETNVPHPATNHDDELNAIDEESRKLRAKLKLLEERKAARLLGRRTGNKLNKMVTREPKQNLFEDNVSCCVMSFRYPYETWRNTTVCILCHNSSVFGWRIKSQKTDQNFHFWMISRRENHGSLL